MKTNVAGPIRRTHEGAPAINENAYRQLRRAVQACLLWEKGFYESGEDVAKRIADLVPQVAPDDVAALAIAAREQYKLRHVPLWIVRQMAKHPRHKALVASTLERVIQRADELAEFVSLYWLDGRQPLSAQVKRGLAAAFTKFDAYQLAKYNRDGAVKLRDVLFLTHARPKDDAQAEAWWQLVAGTLPTPGTWENRLSAGEDKRVVWESMLRENQLGALALLRNLRNMADVGVDETLVKAALLKMKTERVLPFRFISAARAVPQWEPWIESAMLGALAGIEKLPGRTVLLVDVSGSMDAVISSKSDLLRYDAANGLAILARELCEEVAIFSFSYNLVRIPPRQGFALRDAIAGSQPHGGTYLGAAVKAIDEIGFPYDRIIVLTDEQSSDPVPFPAKGARGYMVNVASNQNGVGYGKWTRITGWSEAVLSYIQEIERGG